ncbi:MAG: aminoglycoside phosphotransferase family protein [Pseudomonadota bacterium]
MTGQKIDIHWLWPIMARRAGLDPTAFQHDRAWHGRGERRFSELERFTAPDRAVILKIVSRPHDPARIETLSALQSLASSSLEGSVRAPEVLAHDREGQAIMMEAVSGSSFFAGVEAANSHAEWLGRLGSWLAAFHRATREEERRFQPAFNIRFIERLLADRGRDICERPAFEACAQAVLGALPAFSGQTTQTAAQHGDANLHNFIWDGHAVWGLDFSNPDVAPVGYDVARALLHYAVNFGDMDKLPRGQVLPNREWDAFFEGYDFASPEDPSIQTMLRARLVNDWVRFPGSRRKMPLVQKIRFERAKAVLENLIFT